MLRCHSTVLTSSSKHIASVYRISSIRVVSHDAIRSLRLFNTNAAQTRAAADDEDDDENLNLESWYRYLSEPSRKYHFDFINVPYGVSKDNFTILYSNKKPRLFYVLFVVTLLYAVGLSLLAISILTMNTKDSDGAGTQTDSSQKYPKDDKKKLVLNKWQTVVMSGFIALTSIACVYLLRYYTKHYVLELNQVGKDLCRIVHPKFGLGFVEKFVPVKDLSTRSMHMLLPSNHAHSAYLANRTKRDDYFFLNIAGDRRHFLMSLDGKSVYLNRNGLMYLFGTRPYGSGDRRATAAEGASSSGFNPFAKKQ